MQGSKFFLSRLGSLVILNSLFVSSSQYAFANERAVVDLNIEKIEVTGSRIKRLDLEGISPIVSIDADDIKAQGFNTVYETLQALASANGDNRGQAMGSGTARNAETINLRGLGPNRTLFLLNGKRVANYPRVFDSDNNVFNVASIPMAIVERIEVVKDGSSSIYGSDAVAGVVNIITKKTAEQTSINARFAESGHGDATNKRLSLVTGGADKGNWALSLEYEKQDMLTGKDRDWLDDRFDTPADLASQGPFRTGLPRALAVFHLPPGADDFSALDPGPEVCAKFNDLTYTSISGFGFYCGRDETGDAALIHQRENVSAYATVTYPLSDQDQLQLDMLLWNSKSMRLDSKSWQTDFLKSAVANSPYADNEVIIANNGTAYMLSRSFQPEELLDGKGQQEQFDETAVNVSIRLTGELASGHDYEVFFNHNLAQNTQTSYQLKKEQASDYFVEQSAQTGKLYVDLDKWWQPLSAQGFAQIFGLDKSKSDSYTSTVGASVTGEWFTIDQRSAQFASFIEYEKSAYDLNEHPRTLGLVGEGWAEKKGTSGAGDRNRYAVGFEFTLPASKQLELSASARYDRYLDSTRVKGATTYKLGAQWQPADSLMFRASHGTVFRAPDLHTVHKTTSSQYDYVNDYTLMESCQALAQGRPQDILLEQVNQDALARSCRSVLNNNRGNYGVTNISTGNSLLIEETGYVNNFGVVWAFTPESNLTFDLFNIKQKNLVSADNLFSLNQNEYMCRTGEINPESSVCQHTLQQFERNAEQGEYSYRVNRVRTSYVNTAMQKTTGFDISLDTELALSAQLALHIRSNYNHILETQLQHSEIDEIDKEYREHQYNSDFRSKINTSVTLIAPSWQASLTHIRYGSLWNDVQRWDWTKVEAKRYAPLNLYNLTLGYNVSEQQTLSLGIVNLFDSKARTDASQQHYPYFKQWSYPQTTVIVGRQFSLTYQLSF